MFNEGEISGEFTNMQWKTRSRIRKEKKKIGHGNQRNGKEENKCLCKYDKGEIRNNWYTMENKNRKIDVLF